MKLGPEYSSAPPPEGQPAIELKVLRPSLGFLCVSSLVGRRGCPKADRLAGSDEAEDIEAGVFA